MDLSREIFIPGSRQVKEGEEFDVNGWSLDSHRSSFLVKSDEELN